MPFYVRFGITAAVLCLALSLIDVFTGGAAGPVIRISLYSLATIAASVAASQFGFWRERIGLGWALFAVVFALLLINYIVRRTAPELETVRSVTLVGANLAQIAAYWVMARVLNAAGFGQIFSPAKRVAITVAALGIALLLCWPALRDQWAFIAAGDARPASLVSALADVITFTLIAPIALSAIALRGGQISWIYGFLTLSVFGWMVNTAADEVANLAGGSAPRTIRLAGVLIAVLFNAAAAVTQTVAARRTMKGAGLDV